MPPKAAAAPAPATNPRDQAVDAAVALIEKNFGKGSIMRLKSDEAPPAVPVIPSGCIALDYILGTGGYPRGRIVELYGPESSGKTTLALHAIAEAQKAGGLAAFIDAEHALDITYARKLGVRTEDLLISQPDYGEQALDIAEVLVRSGSIDILVIDSVAALVPKAEIDGEMGDSHVGLHARLMSQAMRKLTGIVAKSNACIMFTNQIRLKIGVMFGSPETTTGGQALKFYASQRLDVRRTGSVKQGDNVIGNTVRVKVVKNKLAPPFREAEFEITYGEGISRAGVALDLAAQYDVVDKSGSWFSYKGERIGQGKEAAKRFLLDNPDMLAAVEHELRDRMGMAGALTIGASAGAEE